MRLLMRAPATRLAASENLRRGKPDDGDFLRAMGRRVREARERRGMSRRAVSEAADVSERYLAQLEGGEGNASVVLLRRVANALGLPLTELVSDNDGIVTFKQALEAAPFDSSVARLTVKHEHFR